jgi:hypothetical protein
MVRLHVKGAKDEECFDYMCGTTASIAMISRDVASISALRQCSLSSCEFDGPHNLQAQHDSIADRTTQSDELIEDSMTRNELRSFLSIHESLSCCSEEDAFSRIQQASLALDEMRRPLRDGFNGAGNGLVGSGVPVPQEPLELNHSNEIEHPQLWCCGKLLCATSGKECLRDFIAVNDNSTLTVYIRSAKEGPPPRHDGIDSTTYRNMVALYHKREENLRHLRAEDEGSRDRDQFLSAPWANPKQLKHSLVGNGGTINYSFYLGRRKGAYCNGYNQCFF